MLYANYNTTHTFNRSAAKSQKPSETKAQKKNNKNQKPKAKSQVKPKPKAKSQMGMQIGSKLQQIARKSEILAPKCSKYKPEARNWRNQKLKAKSQMGMQIGSKLQQIARKSEILAPKCSKYKPEARNQRSQKPKARSQKPKKKCKKKIPLQSKNLFGAQNRFFARTVQKKHVENDWLSYHFPIMSNPLPYASLCSSMLRYADGISWWFTRAMPSAGSLCDQYKQPYVRRTNQCTLQWWVWSCYKRKSYVSLLRHTTGPWIWLVTWLPQGRFQAIHPKQPRHARTMLRSYDAKQCSFRNHKAESITGVETNPRKVALKQKVPVPLKQTKTRERPKSLVMRYIPKWWMVCWTKIKI